MTSNGGLRSWGTTVEESLRYGRDHHREYLQSLIDLLRIPSISMLPEYEPDMRQAATWLTQYLHEMGMTRVETLPGGGYPVVFGEWLGEKEDVPTVLAYGHYDVQPVDPLGEWRTPPFQPSIQGENLFARGASDDKGQLFAVLAAAEAYLKTQGQLPINLKIMLEGEEELASPHMADFVRRHRERLTADAILICDEALLDPRTPVILYGVRGNVYIEMTVCGPITDLHSGTFGGAVDNPLNMLVRLLTRCQDPETRRITIICGRVAHSQSSRSSRMRLRCRLS